MRVELDLAADDERAAMRFLRLLLKRLGRDDGGARCTAIRLLDRAALSRREALDLAEPLLGALLRVLATAGADDAAALALEASGLVRRAAIVAGLATTTSASTAPTINAATGGTEG